VIEFQIVVFPEGVASTLPTASGATIADDLLRDANGRFEIRGHSAERNPIAITRTAMHQAGLANAIDLTKARATSHN
jgi:hypothetical protein